MADQKEIKFSHYLKYFPEIELPVYIGDSTHHAFSQQNKPLPALAIEQFVLPLEGEETDDELTEYIPCFKIPKTDGFHAIVYWKAGLLNYQYRLVTYAKNGELTDNRIIAGTFSDGTSVTKSAATIEEDWMIYVVSGHLGDANEAYDATQSRTIDLEILGDGTIINAIG